MNPPEDAPTPRSSRFSREALIGLGMTILALGVLFLLLGWAETMRLEKGAALVLLSIGGTMFVVGGLAALSGSKRSN